MGSARRPAQNRQMIKYAVRTMLSGRVFTCFLACLIPSLLPWVLRLLPIKWGTVDVLVLDLVQYRISLPMLAISVISSVLAMDPMTVGVAKFFIRLNRDPENLPSPLSVTDCFGPGYWRIVLAMLLRSVRILLWSAVPLLIIVLFPGILSIVTISGQKMLRISDAGYWLILLSGFLGTYRSLGYSMVPYVLSEEPGLSPSEALRESLALTRGRILELFVLELSFLGWTLLTSITFFIAGIYAYPYIEGTMAAYYLAFKEPMPWEKIDDPAG